MKRLHQEVLFGVVVLGLLVSIAFYVDEPRSQGLATTQPTDTPRIHLLSPDNHNTIYKDTIEFSFARKDFEGACSLVINDRIYDRTNDADATIDINLDPGYYQWKVECMTTDGTTISSQSQTFTVKTPEELADKLTKRDNAVTGNVVNDQGDLDTQGVLLALTILAGMVWIVKVRKK
jgi:hypothetical protein